LCEIYDVNINNSKTINETEFKTQIEGLPVRNFTVTVTSTNKGFSSFQSEAVTLEFDSRGK